MTPVLVFCVAVIAVAAVASRLVSFRLWYHRRRGERLHAELAALTAESEGLDLELAALEDRFRRDLAAAGRSTSEIDQVVTRLHEIVDLELLWRRPASTVDR